MFSCKHPSVKRRVSQFTSYTDHGYDVQFAPYNIWTLMKSNFPSVHNHLVDLIVIPEALEKGRSEFKKAIKSDKLRLKVDKLTVKEVCESLDLAHLVAIYSDLMPFLAKLLLYLVETPNKYRTQKAQREAREIAKHQEEVANGVAGAADEQADEEIREALENDGGEDEVEGLTWISGEERAKLIVVTGLSNLLFACNQATNYFSLLFGLFLSIEGSSVRVITCLNKLGLSVSSRTVDRLRTRLSEDAVERAQEVVKGSDPWMVVIDNLNIFVRKDQQRLFNENTMLNITNCAILKFPPSFRWEVLNVPKLLSMRGLRKTFDPRLLRFSKTDEEFLKASFVGIICQRIFDNCPGSALWPAREAMRQSIRRLLPKKNPLDPHKTETFPMGVFDVNEGSKLGIIQVLEQLQERSGLTKEEMASKVRPMAGDLLTILNFRRARNERIDDVTTFERLSYVAEISQPFHMGMNAVIGIISTHLGDSNVNPASLSSHKELLNRKWDPKKPNYSDAKALISHSLIARILDCLMKVLGYEHYSDLQGWRPTFADLVNAANKIHQVYLDQREISKAFGLFAEDQETGDHVLAHSNLFMRDTLFFETFDHGVRHGDPGVLWAVIKVWLYTFRGAGQNNYSRECLELLIRWETELTPAMKQVLEQAWFYNRLGQPGRFIAVDMYLEHLNYWVKRVFVPKGSGVTVENIMAKGSSSVEALRHISAKMSQFCGMHEGERRHRESSIAADVEALVEHLTKEKVHVRTSGRTLWAPSVKPKKGSTVIPKRVSSVKDVISNGISWWDNEKIREYIMTTAWNATEGYPLQSSVERGPNNGMGLDGEDNFEEIERDLGESASGQT
ncbi:hypothetical protein SISSUDRAFT_1029737 [Sistotremastrum suecicum HHB10207 ss-3]|uniref:DUF6589 domain-containing protein n=1 Tax=Sistotremastrum suecicum HHB10207 ss-3 TaxID=1314776 RepID=A0A166IBA4_9AGAM|nr:hypothetical protein SISSUDRAFT_1029737 [Sistotremastrum suecicum HHB10207 ss-3]